MKKLILGLGLLIGGIIGIGLTYISYNGSNWTDFGEFLNWSSIRFLFFLGWILFTIGLYISVKYAYSNDNK